jgi:hypothetical protein
MRKPFKKKNKMTLIIGMKCKDGVLLVADRKVTTPFSNKPKWTTKIHKPLESVPLFYGASGYAHLFKEFNRKIPLIVEQRLREFELKNYAIMREQGVDYYDAVEVKKIEEPKEIQSSDIEETKGIIKKENINIKRLPKPPYVYGHEDFIKDCQKLIKSMCENEDGTAENKLEALLILLDDSGTRLHSLDYDSVDERSYFAIGSGSIFVNEFLDKFYGDDETKDLAYCMKLAMFCILYVERYVKDYSVGVEPAKLPDNQVILNDGQLGTFRFDNEEIVLKELLDKVDGFIKLQDALKF